MVRVQLTGDPVVALSAAAGFHKYVLAPPAVKVVGPPEQIVTGLDEVTVGSGFTVTARVLVFTQFAALVAVMV